MVISQPSKCTCHVILNEGFDIWMTLIGSLKKLHNLIYANKMNKVIPKQREEWNLRPRGITMANSLKLAKISLKLIEVSILTFSLTKIMTIVTSLPAK